MKQSTKCAVSAIRSLIYDKAPIEPCDCEKIYKLLSYHNMTVMAENLIRTNSPEQLTAKMKTDTALKSMYCLKQKAEYGKIGEAFNTNNIPYIPLKGIRLERIYPKNMVREMADIDILVKPKDIPKITEIMKSYGYSHEHSGHHEVYTNKDNICFEIHTKLIDEKRNNKLYLYFENVWDFALKRGNGTEYVLSLEDEYIYLLAHLYGHFHMGGCGIRYILDIWMFERENPDRNCAEIERVLEKYRLKTFADNISKLGDVWFGGCEPDEITDELGDYILTSGIYGTAERYMLSVSEEATTPMESMLRRKLFLSADEMMKRYPWIKNKAMLPIGYIYRGADAIICKRKAVKGMTKAAVKIDKKKIQEYKKMMKRFGA